MNLDVRVGGTLHAPEPSGTVELSQAGFLLPNPRLQAANIKMRAELNGEHITVKELTGNLNGGAFSGGGELKVGTAGMRDVNLFLKGENTLTEYPPAVKTTSSLDVRFTSDRDRLVFSGEIEVQDGYYKSAIDLFSGSDHSFDTGLDGPPDEPSNAVALDLKIVPRRPVEMDNNLGRIAATADLHVAGNVKKVGFLGTIELEQDGKFYFAIGPTL